MDKNFLYNERYVKVIVDLSHNIPGNVKVLAKKYDFCQSQLRLVLQKLEHQGVVYREKKRKSVEYNIYLTVKGIKLAEVFEQLLLVVDEELLI